MHSTHSASLRALAAAAAISGLVTAEPTISLDFPPDLTGQVSIPGFRLDWPFGTENNQVDGWTLQINVTEEVREFGHFAVARFSPPAPPAAGALWDAQTGAWLVAEDVGATWSLKIVSFPVSELPLAAEGNDVENGSCPDSVFSEQCRRDYVEAIAAYGDGPDFGDIKPPGSCKGFVSPNFVSSIKTNASLIDDLYGGWSISKGSMAWQELSRKTWPLILVWGPAAGSGKNLTAENVQFNCVKADRNATTGELLAPGPSGDTDTTATATTTTTLPAPTGSNTPTPTAGASLRAAWSETVAAVAVIVALGVNMV